MARLTESEWQRLLPYLQRLKQHRREAAYQHLVKGVSLASAGEPHGMSRQNVFHVVKTVEKYLDRLQASQKSGAQPLPKGWVRMEVALPRRLVDTARRLVSALTENNGDKKQVKSSRARKS